MYEPLVAKVGYKITVSPQSEPSLSACPNICFAHTYPVQMYIVAVLQIIALVVELTASTWQIFSGGRIIAYFAVGIVSRPPSRVPSDGGWIQLDAETCESGRSRRQYLLGRDFPHSIKRLLHWYCELGCSYLGTFLYANR